jgi:hypothetical protein
MVQRTLRRHVERIGRVCLLAASLGSLACGVSGCWPAARVEPWLEARPLRFRLASTDGRVLEQEPPGGKYLVVIFAASDDLRSLRQIELYERSSSAFTNPPRCIVVAMDAPEARPLVRLFAERLSKQCAVVHAPEELREDGGPFAPVRWVPEVIVYDPLGHEVMRAPGGASGDAIAQAAHATR